MFSQRITTGRRIVKFLQSRHKFPYCSVAPSQVSQAHVIGSYLPKVAASYSNQVRTPTASELDPSERNTETTMHLYCSQTSITTIEPPLPWSRIRPEAISGHGKPKHPKMLVANVLRTQVEIGLQRPVSRQTKTPIPAETSMPWLPLHLLMPKSVHVAGSWLWIFGPGQQNYAQAGKFCTHSTSP